MPALSPAACALLALTATLAVPLASAVPEAVLTSTAAAWDGASAVGTLAGAAHWWPDGNKTTPTAAESFFALHAASVRAAWDTAALYLDAAPVIALPAQTGHGGTTYTSAVIQGDSSGIDRALYVLPLQGQAAQVAASCATAQASTQDHIGAVSHANNTRDPTTATTDDALQVAPCAGSSVTLQGDFLVVLWDWNANVQSQEGNAYLWSGKEPMQGGPDARPYASRAQQVYLTVHNGTMTLPSAAFPSSLFLTAAHLTGASSLTLTDATGTLAGQPLQGHRLRLVGPLDADLTRSVGRLAVASTAPQAGDLDGTPLFLSVTAPGGRGPWGWWLLGGLGLVAVPVLAAPLKRRARRPLRVHAAACRAEEHLCRAEPGAALRLTAKLLRLEPKQPEWRVLHALALLGTDRPADALPHLEAARLMHRAPRLVAQNAQAGALASARLHAAAVGEEERRLFLCVLAWVDEAAQADGRTVADMAGHAELEPFLRARAQPVASLA